MTLPPRIKSVLSFLLQLSTIAQRTAKGEDASTVVPPFRPYSLLSSEDIHSTLLRWKTQHTRYIDVHTAQESFGLETAGTNTNKDCPFDTEVEGCLNYYAVLVDKTVHPPNSQSWRRLPTLLLSGELHGNERVGPTTVMETTRVLLEAATCEAMVTFDDTVRSNPTLHAQQVQDYNDCSSALAISHGMTRPQQQWLAHLLKTRRIVVVPTANALGYFRNSRMEGNVDPNRDFPYDQLASNTNRCMQSIAARTLNEIYRQYVISNSFTFHGGTELLGYEWGGPSHYGSVSPDDVAQDQLARAYSTYGGGFEGSNGRNHPNYVYGDMNSIIYYVRGGFEDFAYAGSWDHSHMVQCTPTTFGGYPTSQTTYEDGMLRSFNMLVETSYSKTPNDNDLGTTWNVLNENSAGTARRQRNRDLEQQQQQQQPHRNLRGGTYFPNLIERAEPIDRTANGHVSRNMRLALAAIEMVQPYLSMTQVNNLALDDNIAATSSPPLHDHGACNSRKYVFDNGERVADRAIKTGAVPLIQVVVDPAGTATTNDVTIDLGWTIGGAMTMEHTHLWVAGIGTQDSMPIADASSWLDEYICGDPSGVDTSAARRLEPSRIKSIFQNLGNSQTGDGFFSPYGSRPAPSADDDHVMGPVFSYTLNLSTLNAATAGTMLVVMASTRVDPDWTELPIGAKVSPSNMGPQSHMVQSRTNSSWYYENGQGHIVQGQAEFFSRPILIQLVSSAESKSGGTATLVNDRFQFPEDAAEDSAMTLGDMVDVDKLVKEEGKEARQHTAAATETIAPSFDQSTKQSFDQSNDQTIDQTSGPSSDQLSESTLVADEESTYVPTFTDEDDELLFTLAPTLMVEEIKRRQVPAPDGRQSFSFPTEKLPAVSFAKAAQKDDDGESKRRLLQPQTTISKQGTYVSRRTARLQGHLLQARP